MFSFVEKNRLRLLNKIFSIFIVCAFAFSAVMPPITVFGQQVLSPALNLPLPGNMVALTPVFNPPLVKGIIVHPENPMKFDFLVSPGDDNLTGTAFREESRKLIKYFLASLTVPDEELWVNLSPYEKNRVIAEQFGRTEMGRDMLAQDYILKQLSASLMYPENELGKKFWDKVYKKAYEKYGTAEIPMNTFNKIWIVPEKAVVYEHEQTAFVIESHLKVMLEEDYVALQKSLGASQFGLDHVSHDDAEIISGATSEVVREVLLPELEREVNEGATFANLRQIYNSLILATWYKDNLRDSLLGHIYVDRGKTKGVHQKDARANQKIYERYVEAFKAGVYNYIKEDYDPATQQIIPRKYFSGGNNFSRTDDLRVDTRSITPQQAADASSPVQKVEVELYSDNPTNETAIADAEKSFVNRDLSAASPVTWERDLVPVIIDPQKGTKNEYYKFEIIKYATGGNAYIIATDQRARVRSPGGERYFEQRTIAINLNNALPSTAKIGDQINNFIQTFPLNNGINDLTLDILQSRIGRYLKRISASSPIDTVRAGHTTPSAAERLIENETTKEPASSPVSPSSRLEQQILNAIAKSLTQNPDPLITKVKSIQFTTKLGKKIEPKGIKTPSLFGNVLFESAKALINSLGWSAVNGNATAEEIARKIVNEKNARLNKFAVESLEKGNVEPFNGILEVYTHIRTISGEEYRIKVEYATAVTKLRADLKNSRLTLNARHQLVYKLAQAYAAFGFFGRAKSIIEDSFIHLATKSNQKSKFVKDVDAFSHVADAKKALLQNTFDPVAEAKAILEEAKRNKDEIGKEGEMLLAAIKKATASSPVETEKRFRARVTRNSTDNRYEIGVEMTSDTIRIKLKSDNINNPPVREVIRPRKKDSAIDAVGVYAKINGIIRATDFKLDRYSDLASITRELDSIESQITSVFKGPASSPVRDASAEQRDTNPGGIDFNPALMDLQIKRDVNGIPLPFHLQPIEVMDIEGLIPVIIKVTPVLNVPLLLGVDNTGQGTAEAAHNTLQGPMEPRMQFKAVEPEQVSYLN